MLIRLISRFIRHIKQPGDEADEVVRLIRQAGLGPRHVPALFALAMNGPTPVGVLAGHMALSPATVSQLVGELERAGFVRRREDERDRRRTIVGLDERLAPSVERLARQRLEPLRMTLETLTPAERAQFLGVWQVLVEMQDQVAKAGGCSGAETVEAPEVVLDGQDVDLGEAGREAERSHGA